MPKYEVEMNQLVRRMAAFVVDAEDEDDAREKAWDEMGTHPERWYEKFVDSDASPRRVPESAS